MHSKLHADFATWMDGEASRIVQYIEDLTERGTTKPGLHIHPDQPIAFALGPNDLVGEPTRSEMDICGAKVAHFYPHNGRVIGLSEAGLAEVSTVCERIWSRRELRDVLSLGTIEQKFLQWVGATAREIATPPMSEVIETMLTAEVGPISVWIPIDELYVEHELAFARAILRQLSRGVLEEILDAYRQTVSAEWIEQCRQKISERWLGKAVMCFRIVAHEERSKELSLEYARKYMALLQFYSAPAMKLRLASHSAPSGTQPYRTLSAITSFGLSEHISEVPWRFKITSDVRAEMERLGVYTLSSLAMETACEYEEKLLDSLIIYGRALYHLDPADKLLQIMTALEMFALRNGSEPIAFAVADRLAFAITTAPEKRAEIVQNFRATYALRSGRTHHGRSISDIETIEEFMKNAWSFFLVAIRGVGRYRTRIEFLDYLDRMKYGR